MVLKTYGAVFGERFGSGSPRVLALHGWGRDRNDFREVLRDLDAVAIDLPGFGASPPPSEAMGAAGYASAIVPVLSEFAEPPIVLGHSFGGRVAVHLGLTQPTRALILIAVPLIRAGRSSRVSSRFRFWRGLHRLGLVNDERMEQVRHRYGSRDYRAARGVMRQVLVEVLGESYEKELSLLDCPVDLVWGADDDEVPVDVAEAALKLLLDGQLTVLPGIGHQVPRQAPEQLRVLVAGRS